MEHKYYDKNIDGDQADDYCIAMCGHIELYLIAMNPLQSY